MRSKLNFHVHTMGAFLNVKSYFLIQLQKYLMRLTLFQASRVRLGAWGKLVYWGKTIQRYVFSFANRRCYLKSKIVQKSISIRYYRYSKFPFNLLRRNTKPSLNRSTEVGIEMFLLKETVKNSKFAKLCN